MTAPSHKWDARWRERDARDAQPCAVLAEYAHLLPPSGRMLDLAGGLGGNARLCAERGLEAVVWDCSPVAVEKVVTLGRELGLPLDARVVDVEARPLPAECFAVVVASRFLNREFMPDYLELLEPGGLLYWQTWTREAVPPVAGPANPAWRLARNELLHLCGGLELLAYREEGLVGDLRQGMRGEAWIVARKAVTQTRA